MFDNKPEKLLVWSKIMNSKNSKIVKVRSDGSFNVNN